MAAFTDSHHNQLLWSYPEEIVDQITDESQWQYAAVPGMPGETIPYVDIKPSAMPDDSELPHDGRTIMYVPGFVEGIVNKASFAAELASRGHRVILPGQNRAAIAKVALDGRSMTELQADSYAAVMEDAGIVGEQPDVFAHSYGGLIFNAMSRRMRANHGANPFEKSTVFFGDSAGMIEDESYGRLFTGWAKMLGSEMSSLDQDFPDLDGSTGKASLRTMAANMARTLGEARQLANEKVDPELPHYVDQLIVINYAKSMLYPSERTAPHIGKLVANGAVWLTPYSLDTLNVEDGQLVRGVSGATHDDEQRNPARVVNAMQMVYDSRRNG